MGSAYIPQQNFSDQLIGTTSEISPVLLLEVDGVVYPNGYRINYNGGYRNFYPSINSSGQVFVTCHTIAYGEDLAQFTLPSNTKVHVITAYAGPVTPAQPSLGLGYDQIWQNVTGVRAFGLTYSNDTGNPIQVSIGASTSGAGGGVNIAVNNQALGPTFSATGGVQGSSPTVVVPPGATYLATPYGNATLSTWFELRSVITTQTNTGFGINQTWQNVTSSRAWATPYTNTTGKPIQVIVSIGTTSIASGVGLVVDGVTLPGTMAYGSGVTTSSPAYIIPAGSTYKSVLFGDGGGSYAAWYELRGATVSGESTGIGYNQTWQDFSGVRAFDTTYTNNTSRPIQVVFNASTIHPGGGVFLTVNGVTLPPTFTYTGVMGTVSAVAVVPVGATYRASAYSSPSYATYVSCFELRDIQYFSTSGTFTVPAGVTSITIVACGGGGGGGGGSSRWMGSFTGGAGGGRGELRSVTVSVTPGQTITYEVGAGGLQGGARDGPYPSNVGSDGTAGGTSRASINGGATWVVVANGGQGGLRSNTTNPTPGAAGGSGGIGTVVVASAAGGNGVNMPAVDKYTPPQVAGGGGAAGYRNFSGQLGTTGVGGIGDIIYPPRVAVSGTGYGAGGSGGGVNGASNAGYFAGTDGLAGFVYIGY